MAGLIRCRACGYVTGEDFTGDTCPACGVPVKSFEPFTDPVSAPRRRWLNQHVHQVSVHFPQAFAMFLFGVLFAGNILAPYPVFSARLFNTAWVVSIVFPFAVLGGLVTGIIDARVRYKRLSPRYLRTKIVVGIVFFLLAAAEAVIIEIAGISSNSMYFLLTLNAGAILCSLILGKVGGALACAAMGGK